MYVEKAAIILKFFISFQSITCGTCLHLINRLGGNPLTSKTCTTSDSTLKVVCVVLFFVKELISGHLLQAFREPVSKIITRHT